MLVHRNLNTEEQANLIDEHSVQGRDAPQGF